MVNRNTSVASGSLLYLSIYLGILSYPAATILVLTLLSSINKWYALAIRDLIHFISTAWLIRIFGSIFFHSGQTSVLAYFTVTP